MANVTFAQVMTQLNVTKKQLLLLMKNPQFPAETGGTSSDTATFLDTAINAFQTTMQQTKANGFVLNESNLATLPFNVTSAAPRGRYVIKQVGDYIDDVLVERNPVVGP